jgi:hypothetical protein
MAAFGVCAVDQQAANAHLPHFVEGDFLMAIRHRRCHQGLSAFSRALFSEQQPVFCGLGEPKLIRCAARTGLASLF